MTKQEILKNVLSLNGDDKKYKITVLGDRIITEVKWMDAVFFTPASVTDEIKQFKFTVELKDDNKWLEIDESKSLSKSFKNGSFGMQYSSFKGKEISFNKTISFGKNRETGEVGVIEITFNSEEYKKPVREYLEKQGYKKTNKGFFCSLFKK